MPGGAIKEALEGVTGLAGKTVIDATNLNGGATPPDGADSNAACVESVAGGPTAKAWNINFAALFDQVADASTPPGNLWCGDEEARAAVERLNANAGYQPVHCGGLDRPPIQVGFLDLAFAIAKDGDTGPFFYKFAPPADF